ncbi:MAG: cation diffusion facilitator family transporter [Bryobacterales bacterium]|nr:cation diffusion facilitator family transporter [Bryobacteraceae bacterium]MDW8129707.1 cation diffusion facilitator family transporter [Bryobacterales bacterium]
MHAGAPSDPHAGRTLQWSLVLTIAFVIAELAAGIQANSLALLSDAAHNFTDALALLLAWFGYRVGQRPADDVKTYGYHRAGVLAAFVNALALLGLAAYIFYASYRRWLQPRPVHETTMLIVAALGLVVNLAIMHGLEPWRRRDLNIRSAWAHMLGDALGSLGIVAGALLMRWTGWLRVDPLLSALIGLLIVWTAWDIVRESLNILLEGLPRGMELDSVVRAMREIPGVLDVHDIHIWSLGSTTHALSCHVVIEDVPPSESEGLLRRLNQMLAERFLICHTTIQFEHAACEGCTMPNHRSRSLAAESPQPHGKARHPAAGARRQPL